MLKFWVALLVVLNAAALAWQWDALAPWGLGPEQHQEPERLQQQLRPEAIQTVPVQSAQDVSPAQAPSPSDAPAGGAAPAPQPGLTPGSTPASPSAPLSSLPAASPSPAPANR